MLEGREAEAAAVAARLRAFQAQPVRMARMYTHGMEPLQQQAGRHISPVHPLPLSTIEMRSPARNVMASDYTASHLAIYTINGEMGLLRSSGEGYTARRTACGVKVKVRWSYQHSYVKE